MNQEQIEKVKAALKEVEAACEDTGEMIYDTRAMMEKYDLPHKDKGLALLQYAMVYLRVQGITEDHLYLLTAGAISRAYCVSLQDAKDAIAVEAIEYTPHYPAEPGECN